MLIVIEEATDSWKYSVTPYILTINETTYRQHYSMEGIMESVERKLAERNAI